MNGAGVIWYALSYVLPIPIAALILAGLSFPIFDGAALRWRWRLLVLAGFLLAYYWALPVIQIGVVRLFPALGFDAG